MRAMLIECALENVALAGFEAARFGAAVCTVQSAGVARRWWRDAMALDEFA